MFLVNNLRGGLVARGMKRERGKRTARSLLVGKPEGKKSLGRPRCRWVDNIEMDRMGWGGLDWSGSG
jgi:hypothetical protein